MKFSTNKSTAPKKLTDTEEKNFWRAKKKIAFKHKKIASKTNNTGWVKMLGKRVNKYDAKIKKLSEHNSFLGYLLEADDNATIELPQQDIPKVQLTQWPDEMLKVIERMKTTGDDGRSIDPYNTKEYVKKFKKFSVKTGTEIGNGAIYVAVYLDSQQSSPELNAGSTYEDIEQFLIKHIEANGADVYFNNTKIEVKDGETLFRVGGSSKSIAKAVTLVAPINTLLDAFKTKYFEYFQNTGDQEAINEFNSKYAVYFEPDVSWGIKKYEFFTAEDSKRKSTFATLKKYIDSRLKDVNDSDAFDRKGFTDNILTVLSSIEQNADITSKGQYIKALNDIIKDKSVSSFADSYKDLYGDIISKSKEIHNALQTLATSILGSADQIYFTKKEGFVFADVSNVSNTIKVTSISSGRANAKLNI
jgi:hypothetical protein